MSRRGGWEVTLFFLVYMLVTSIAVMELLTAVIVSGSMENMEKDKVVHDQVKKDKLLKLLPVITDFFQQIDRDNNGIITIEEMMSAPDEVKDHLMSIVDSDNLVALFSLIDSDNSGAVDRDEFIDELSLLITSGRSFEHFFRDRNLFETRTRALRLQNEAKRLDKRVDTFEEKITSLVTRRFNEILLAMGKAPLQISRDGDEPLSPKSPKATLDKDEFGTRTMPFNEIP